MGLKDYWNELMKPEAEVEAQPQLVPGWAICECCQQSINPDLVKTFSGKKYHKKCWKKNVKLAKKVWGLG